MRGGGISCTDIKGIKSTTRGTVLVSILTRVTSACLSFRISWGCDLIRPVFQSESLGSQRGCGIVVFVMQSRCYGVRRGLRIASCIQLSLFWPELSDTPFWGTTGSARGHQGKHTDMELHGARLCSAFGRSHRPPGLKFFLTLFMPNI